MELHSKRSRQFPVPVDELWTAVTSVDRYQEWWPWLTTLEADGFRVDDPWRCAVRPPLGYSVAFQIHLDEVVDATRAAATISGDIEGHAVLRVEDEGRDTSSLELEAWLSPASTLLRAMMTVARPVATRGHDWILDTGLEQFHQRALPDAP
jgi:uncharacterized protein YndB with AHSA1/START domain